MEVCCRNRGLGDPGTYSTPTILGYPHAASTPYLSMNLGGHDSMITQDQIGLVRRTDPYVARVNLTMPSLQPMVSRHLRHKHGLRYGILRPVFWPSIHT